MAILTRHWRKYHLVRFQGLIHANRVLSRINFVGNVQRITFAKPHIPSIRAGLFRFSSGGTRISSLLRSV